MTSGEGYAQRHLRQSDYYDQNRTVEGRWCGRGAELLGLKGEVTSEDFEAVRQGLDPQTGEFLRQRHSADRIASNGAEQSKARSLYDMTFSAPKSVSVMAVVAGDERLVAAHTTAVREALEEAEKYSATRVRLAGLNENRATGNWIVASYTHDTSRQLDPQLHTHAVAANLTYDGTEGRWKALQASGLYERRSYLTEVYRNTLAREVRALGYEVENRHDVRGRDKGFEIAGFSRTSSTSTVNAAPSGMQQSKNSPTHVAVRQQTTRLRYWSGKRGPTSFKRYRPSESAAFSKNDCQWMRGRHFVRF